MSSNSSIVGLSSNALTLTQDLTVNVTGLPALNSSDPAGPAGLTLVAKVTVTLMVVAMVVIVVGNTLVLVAVASFSTLRDISSIFIANLAVADLIIGLSHPFQIVFFFYPELERNKHACILRYTIITFACNASIFSLACTVIDRFVAISFPLTYPSIITERRVGVMIGLIWIVDFIYCLLPTVGLNHFDTSPFCLYELVIDPAFRLCSTLIGLTFAIFMFVMYMRIFQIARRHIKQIAREGAQQPAQQGVQDTRSKHQSYVITALVVLFFQISWLPFFSVQLSMYDRSDVTESKVIAANFCVFLGILNSTVNPVIYAWKNRQYRKAFYRILRLNFRDDLDQSSAAT